MRRVFDRTLQTVVMAAIVATLAAVPIGGLLAIAALSLPGISFHDLISFGGAVSSGLGLLLWWLLGFALALAYAAIALDWHS